MELQRRFFFTLVTLDFNLNDEVVFGPEKDPLRFGRFKNPPTYSFDRFEKMVDPVEAHAFCNQR